MAVETRTRRPEESAGPCRGHRQPFTCRRPFSGQQGKQNFVQYIGPDMNNDTNSTQTALAKDMWAVLNRHLGPNDNLVC